MRSSRLFAIALLSVASMGAVSVAARGQSESKSTAATKQTLVMDIRVVEVDPDGAAELQRSGYDQKVLDDLFASGKARLIAGLDLQGVYNRTVTAHLGRRVPIQVGSFPVATRADARNPAEPASFGFGIPQIQYQDTGISVSAAIGSPVNRKISIGLDLKLNDVSSPTATLTPVLISKSISSTISAGEGEMVPVLSVIEPGGMEGEPRAGRTPARPPLRFMVLLTAHSVD